MSSIPEQQTDNAPRADDEISLLDFALVVAKHKWLVVGLPLVAAIVAAVISLNLTPIYTGTVRLLPPQQTQSMAGSLLGGLGQLGGLAGGVSGVLGIKNPSDIYVGMLRSRTVADGIVDRFNLLQVYDAKLRSDAREKLAKATSINVGKDNLISLEVDDPDPKRAAALANAYIEELEKVTSVLAITEAGQRRLFFERQLAQAKESLITAEQAARSAMDEGGIAAVDAHGRTLIQTAATIRARVAAKEVELNAMRGFATEQNPTYRKVQEELAALREQLAKLERGDTSTPRGVKVEALKNVSLLREVRFHEVLFELLARQYEMAKVDEAKEGAVIQVLDKAIEPDRRSRPRRTFIVIVTTAVAAVVAILIALLLDALDRARRDPSRSARLAQMRTYLWRQY